MKRINVTRTKPMNEKTNPSGTHLESALEGLDGPNRYKTITLLLTILFAALLAAQVLFLIRCNLTDIINYVDSDMGMGLYHFREMIRNHTIDLPGYTNTTTLEVDTSFLLAVPFYLLTRNFSLSVGLSNICIIAAYAVIVRGIMAELGTKRMYRLITLILVFTPYAIGMLDYLNMMFLGLSCYSFKTMVPLLGVWFLLMKGEHPIRRGAVLALYSVLLFITTMSTGVYVMLSGIAPILLFGAVRMWQEDSVFLLKDKAKVVWGGMSIAAFGLGNVFYNRLYTENSRTNTLLNLSDLFIDNTLSYIKGFFLLFGALPDRAVRIVSLAGVSYLVKVVLVFALLGACVRTLWRRRSPQQPMQAVLAVIFLWNVFIIFVSQTRISEDTLIQYRYLLLGSLPLLILLGKDLSDRSLGWSDRQEAAAGMVLFLALAVLEYGCDRNVQTYLDEQNAYLKEICQYIDTLPVKSVIWLNDTEYFNKCRGVDDGHIWGCYLSQEQRLYTGANCYEAAGQSSFYAPDEPSALICYTNVAPADFLSEEAAAHYTHVGTVEYFEVYVSDGVYF